MRGSFYDYCFGKSFVLILVFILVGCSVPGTAENKSNNQQPLLNPGTGEVSITFRATLHQPLSPGNSIFISLLDEVSGLAFNAREFQMDSLNETTYSITLPLEVDSVIKYRYKTRGTNPRNEYQSNGLPIRYRLYHVEGQAIQDDLVVSWNKPEPTGRFGKISGVALDNITGNPIPNILVTASGIQSLSREDGTFLLEGVPDGTHNLVFFSLDGSFQIYQQKAVVSVDATTPALVKLNPAKLVTGIFTITAPATTPGDASIRMAGNLYQLGNTFSDLTGGMSVLAAKMPMLGKLPDGRYMVALNLPAGTYLEYKYTMGDGLWSSELNADGSLRLRNFIIPDHNFEMDEIVETWNATDSNPVHFEARVPALTPQVESIFIQFNPGFGWLEPIPMRLDNYAQAHGIWKFDLTGPFNDLTEMRYRYCRNGQCGSADDASTMGINPGGRIVHFSNQPVTVNDEIFYWAWLSSPGNAALVPDVTLQPRDKSFVAGVSIDSRYHPLWDPLFEQMVFDINQLSANWLIVNPSWTITSNNPPILESIPGLDILSPDLINLINLAQKQDLKLGLFPQLHYLQQNGTFPRQFPLSVQDEIWWKNGDRQYDWWVSFFEEYSVFILNYAALASQTNASSLILGGDWLLPALPDGKLQDGTPSNVPAEAESRWRDLIAQVREIYSGLVVWAISYPLAINNPPPFMDAVDQVYVLWSGNLGYQPNTPLESLNAQADTIFADTILPFQQEIGKPVIIAISSPSIDAGTSRCVNISGENCLNYDLSYAHQPDFQQAVVNLEDQANTYNALLASISRNPSISGFISMGYYPPVTLQDKSISIRGKPAGGVFWYWANKFLGQ